MEKRMSFSKLATVLLAIVIVAVISGCGKKNGVKDEVIAKINNYELTTSDFLEEARIVVPAVALANNQTEAKKYTMNELITKKVLLQEAQKENFDKDKKFMKEIERYWEQALLKLLIQKKIEEFSKKIPPDVTGEVRQKTLQAELMKWVMELKKSAKWQVYDNVYNKVEIK